MKTVCFFVLVLIAVFFQGCATGSGGASLWDGTVGGSLNVRDARNDLVEAQLRQRLEVIAAAPQLTSEQEYEIKAISPIIVLDNVSGRDIDLSIYDRKDRKQQPLSLTVEAGQVVILPDDHPEVIGFFHFERSYVIEFGYVGEGRRSFVTMYVGAQGGWYDVSSSGDTASRLQYYHGKMQFRRSSGAGLYRG